MTAKHSNPVIDAAGSYVEFEATDDQLRCIAIAAIEASGGEAPSPKLISIDAVRMHDISYAVWIQNWRDVVVRLAIRRKRSSSACAFLHSATWDGHGPKIRPWASKYPTAMSLVEDRCTRVLECRSLTEWFHSKGGAQP
jgi:hypothetical protein